jgi:NAD(P)-dependent dehydrogenase (short-subunit alcohol dehydrogenase family)
MPDAPTATFPPPALAGSRYVVTGAASGIGAAVTAALHAAGAETLAIDRAACPDQPHAAAVSVADRPALAQAIASFGAAGLDGVVCSAGVVHRARLADQSAAAHWDETIDVNLTGAFTTVQAARPHLRHGASIVLVASIQSFIHLANSVAYSASKGGVAMLARALAHELGPMGIRVNAVAPGPIVTGLTRAVFDDPAIVARHLARMPIGRLGTAEDVAGPVLFLLSDAAAFVTGAVLPVDGGYLVS